VQQLEPQIELTVAVVPTSLAVFQYKPQAPEDDLIFAVTTTQDCTIYSTVSTAAPEFTVVIFFSPFFLS
jgi:hypothetical protein